MKGTSDFPHAGVSYRLHDLRLLAEEAGIDLASVPFSGRVLLESILRNESRELALTCARRLAVGEEAGIEFAFRPARLLLQDYTGVPALVDLAAMRDHASERAGDPRRINPVVRTDVVIDHSLQADVAGVPDAQERNEREELLRNEERFAFLGWASRSFDRMRVFPPGNGIVHQINLERLASVVTTDESVEAPLLLPDTVIGTDSHTTMVNGLGVLGWGVGGLEAESIMLGVPVTTRVPPIIGVRLSGELSPGVTATDLVLTLTERLRAEGVVGAWIEFTGPALGRLSATDRCTVANMAPEYGAMLAFFPVDAQTLHYLRLTGRAEQEVVRVEAYCRRQGLLWEEGAPSPRFGRLLEFNLGTVEACVAGPSAPHQRVSLGGLRGSFERFAGVEGPAAPGLSDGAIVIAAITSCTNTSNPTSMIAAGLLARRAVERGLRVPAHVKTSLAPGSPAVTRYLREAGLLEPLEALGFHVIGYGCTTCNGGSGPLKSDVAEQLARSGAVVASVLSGNRNFEGRVHVQTRANYLASPALVVALALAGNVRVDLDREPLAFDAERRPVSLRDIWPGSEEVARIVAASVRPDVFTAGARLASFDAARRDDAPLASDVFSWKEASTYIRRPPYLSANSGARTVTDARALVALGDDVSTDQISPVGAISERSPAGRYLSERGVLPTRFNSYGSRRGNHEVMARGTFSSSGLKNLLVPGLRGGDTVHLASGQVMPVFEAAQAYRATGTPLVVLAGRNYGMGSSRDWAAKGPWMLGVRAVIAESFERIHRSNLIAMGILPIEFEPGDRWWDLGLTGHERFSFEDVHSPRARIHVHARGEGTLFEFKGTARIDSEGELALYLHGGMLPYLLHSPAPGSRAHGLETT
ncbi:aconitate hydratase AcnA [Corallococcus sp. CA047B]|uniref:aconitate hydratase AcnA n=1 Tax=Corallococcus sp. CA047B TaxID=2316729 RepID=UPI000EA12DF0|nr:aconitate hydratase AcnA [Corallococcus sp. CA047B]RKH18187.1 aconitate hydratase AcnA [Corallococcus sp. CA047B]